MNKRSALAIVALAVLIVLSGCSKKTFSNSSSWLPPGFNPRTQVLLIADFNNTKEGYYQRKMEVFMHEHYPYRYEFVPIDTIMHPAGKYADVALYEYALVWSKHYGDIMTTDGNGRMRNIKTIGIDFNFYDRQRDHNYPPTKRSSSFPGTVFKPLINTIMKKFPAPKK